MPTVACPTRSQIEDYSLGLASDADAERMLEHLRECARCGDVAAGVESRDVLMDALRRSQELPQCDADEQNAVVEGVRRVVASALAASDADASGGEAQFDGERFGFDSERDRELWAMFERRGPADAAGRLGKYRILRKLGSGGMGAVLLAEDTLLGSNVTVALKVMLPHRTSADARRRFLNEARAAFQLAAEVQHPNLVGFRAVNEIAGALCIELEALHGLDLERWVATHGVCPPSRAVAIVLQAAEGLAYAHGRGVVHRDVKPLNVMFADETARTVKVLDLGLAMMHGGETAGQATQPGTLLGTPEFMAPEQVRDSRGVDGKADVYGLGATWRFLISGTRPRQRVDRMTGVFFREPDAGRAPPQCPPGLESLLERMLSLDPNRRPSMSEVVAELRAHERSRAAQDTSAPTADGVAPRTTGGGEWRPRRRTLVGSLLAIVAVASCVFFVASAKGRVELETLAGDPPNDLAVELIRNGTVVEVLAAGNGWRAALAGGEVDAKLVGGDRFELESSRLVVHRFGRTVVKIRSKVSDGGAADLATPSDPAHPTPPHASAGAVLIKSNERNAAGGESPSSGRSPTLPIAFNGAIAGIASDVRNSLRVEATVKGQKIALGQFDGLGTIGQETGFGQAVKERLRRELHDCLDDDAGLTLTGTFSFAPGEEPGNEDLHVIVLTASIKNARGRELLPAFSREANDTDDIFRAFSLTGAAPTSHAVSVVERNSAARAAAENPIFETHHGYRVAAVGAPKLQVGLLKKRTPDGEATPIVPQSVAGKAYAPIGTNEYYDVEITNSDSIDVVATIEVDGLDVANTFCVDADPSEKRLRFPGYFVPRGETIVVRGWLRTMEQKPGVENVLSFLVTELGRGAASARKARGKIGAVTVQFREAVPPGAALSRAVGGETTTGEGLRERLDSKPVTIGELVISTVSIRYNRPE